MFKVSFKDTLNKPSKVINRYNGKVTEVTLCGQMRSYDEWSSLIPYKVRLWAYKHKGITIQDLISCVIIKVKGKAIKSDYDADNPVYAERIAEARAKIKLYNFMVTLLRKTLRYYTDFLFGKDSRNYSGNGENVLSALNKYIGLYDNEVNHLNNLLAMT